VDTNDTITSEELAAYVAGELDHERSQHVQRWAALDPANALELRRLQDTWNMIGPIRTPTTEAPDVDRAWGRLKARMEEADVPRIRSLWSQMRPWLAAAAMLAVVFTVVRLWLDAPTVHVAEQTSRTLVLDDGSTVVLAPGSELAEDMDGRRHVKVEGIAYFEVRHDAQHPFEVHVDDVLVTVLGTAFEVRTSTDTSVLAVRVRSGQVRVEAGGDALVLKAGERARFDQRLLLERTPVPTVQVWGARVLQFSQAPLERVVSELERMFEVRIELGNPALQRCQLTAEFDEEPISVILQVIAETFGLQLEQPEGSVYLLTGDGC
jgi:ferric-dicitrate binding protein FerR (iron transport regulator)